MDSRAKYRERIKSTRHKNETDGTTRQEVFCFLKTRDMCQTGYCYVIFLVTVPGFAKLKKKKKKGKITDFDLVENRRSTKYRNPAAIKQDH